MYGKEKTGLRRLWDYKIVFFAAVAALVATFGQLAASYLYYLPGFADMRPFDFLASTVLRWVLLAAPAYCLVAYLEDHYATEHNRRFTGSAIVATVSIILLLIMSRSAYFGGFTGNMTQLSYSVAMTLLLLLPITGGLSVWLCWKPIVTWIVSGLCAAAMITLAVFSLTADNIPNFLMALSYVFLCAGYFLALPKILTYVPPVEEEEDDTPTEAAIMKDYE